MALIGALSHILAPLVGLAGLVAAVWLLFHGLWGEILWSVLFCFLGSVALGLGGLLTVGLVYVANKVFRPRIAGALGMAVMYLSGWFVAGWFLSFYFEAAKQIPEQWIPHILLGGAAAMVPFAGVGTVAKHEDEVHILINTALGSAAVTTTVLLFHAVGIAWTLFNSLFFIGYLAQLSESKPIGTRAGSGTCKPQSLVTQPESADE